LNDINHLKKRRSLHWYDAVVATDDAPKTPGAERLGLLLARHGAITNIRIRQALGVTGLTPRQSATLLKLSTGALSQQTLIESLGVDPSIVVAILNELETQGLAQRRRDPADRRRHIVEITVKGTEVLGEVDNALTTVERQLFADLDAEELRVLEGLLARIHTSFDDPACSGD
jgi:DNA-binding MarR family transcriptional regulator